jgi:trigger factor
MPNISAKDLDNLTSEVTVSIAYEDYGKAYNKKLAEYQKTATFKGFRTGKTPMSFIKKMYGKQVLANELNTQLQDTMMEYLEGKSFLGQPVPVNQDDDLDLKSKKSYDFVFELGKEPEFELKGFSAEDTFEKYVVKMDDKYLDREVRELKSRNSEVVEEAAEVKSDNDVLRVNLKELEGDTVKENGVTSETYLSLDLFKSDELREAVKGKKPGDTFTAKYDELSKEFTNERTIQYILKLEKDANGEYPTFNDMFQVEILSIRQVQSPELNKEFFDKVVGEGEAEDEATFRTVLTARIEDYLQQEADVRFFLELQKNLLAVNQFDMPEAFLQKWLLFRNEESTEEKVISEMPSFLESLKWTLIKSKIEAKYELEVADEEIKAAMGSQIRQILQGQGDQSMVDMLVGQFMESQEDRAVSMREEAYQNALNTVILKKAKEVVAITDNEITATGFDEIMTQEYEKRQAEEGAKAAALAAAEADAVAAKETIEAVVSDAEVEEISAEVDATVEAIADEAEKEITE